MNHSNKNNDAKAIAQQPDNWTQLKQFTDARIALGRAGVSLPTHVQLQFSLDHALARDAVSIPLNTSVIMADIETQKLKVLHLHSKAPDRPTYLQRPDLGRKLNQHSVKCLQQQTMSLPDVAIVLVDGLSSVAVQSGGVRLVTALHQRCRSEGLSCSDILLVEQGRVAIGDEIGQLLEAKMVVLIVGERPGLSSPDSLGIYFTYGPAVGLTDVRRNCISNIRPAGLSTSDAVEKTIWLMKQAQKLKTSGVELKDHSAADESTVLAEYKNFLLPEE